MLLQHHPIIVGIVFFSQYGFARLAFGYPGYLVPLDKSSVVRNVSQQPRHIPE